MPDLEWDHVLHQPAWPGRRPLLVQHPSGTGAGRHHVSIAQGLAFRQLSSPGWTTIRPGYFTDPTLVQTIRSGRRSVVRILSNSARMPRMFGNTTIRVASW